jgi:hypothetical protein
MPFKYDDAGNIVTQDKDGKKLPVYVHPDGAETAFDADGTLARITALNTESAGHRLAAKEAGERLKAFEGLDAAQARQALDTVKNLADGELIKAGKAEEMKAAAVKTLTEQIESMRQAQAQQLATEKAANEKLQGQLHAEIVNGSFARSKFVGEKLAIPADMAQAAFGRHFKVEEGKLAAYDAQGNRIHSRQRPGDPNVDFEEAIEMIVDAYPNRSAILKGSGGQGGGADPSGGKAGARTITRAEFARVPPEQRATVLKERQLVD